MFSGITKKIKWTIFVIGVLILIDASTGAHIVSTVAHDFETFWHGLHISTPHYHVVKGNAARKN